MLSSRVLRNGRPGWLFSFLVLFISVPLLAAGKPWDGAPFSSDPKVLLEAAQAVPAKDDDVVVLLDEGHFVFDAQGRVTSTRRMVYRVVNEAGVEDWSSIEAPWSPWFQERPTVQARVVTAEGAVHMLDPKSFGLTQTDDESGGDIFDDTRIVHGPLPAVAPGSVIEQVVTYRERNPMYDAGTIQRFDIGKYVPVQATRVTIDYPSSLTLHLVNHTSPEVTPVRTETDGVIHLVFEIGLLPKIELYEWNLPSDLSLSQSVSFSTGKSWQEVARRYSEIVDKQIGEPLGAPVKTAAGDAKEPRAIATRLLAAVQRDVRYAGVEFGDGSIIPRTPRETLSHKYGDCKDKATLLVAMLREAGVAAHVALLESGYGRDVRPELPGMGSFNHAIVVTDAEPRIWIDPTDEFARAGELPSQDQGRQALVASPSTTALLLTPVSDAPVNRTVETREFTLAEDGKARVVETTVAAGDEERSMRRGYATSETKQVRERLESYVKGAYLAKSLGTIDLGDAHNLAKPFQVRIEAIEAGRGITADGEAAVGIFPSALANELPPALQNYKADDPDATAEEKEKVAKRKRVHDFVFATPYVWEWHYRIQPPPGFVPRKLPESTTVKMGTTTLTESLKVGADGVILADFTFDSGPRRITAKQYEETRRAVQELRDQKAMLIYFDQTAKLRLDAGEVGQALAEYRKLVTLHPKEALHHIDIAKALLAGGLGEEARSEAKLATQIDPKSAKAFHALGWILEHDLLGRRYRKGYDQPAAIAAYRKAKELDPKEFAIRAELAALLERGDDGHRYGRNARLAEAVIEYLETRTLKGEEENASVDQQLMADYAYSGRYQELEQLTKKTKDTESKDGFRLVAVAALHDGPAAVKESESLDAATRRAKLQKAGSFLALIRLYPQSAALLSAAAQGAPNADALRKQADEMLKMHRTDDLPMPDNAPATVLKRMMIEFVNGGMDDKKLAGLMSKEANEFFSDDEKSGRAAKEARSVLIRSTLREGVPAPFFCDVMLSNLEITQEGDDNIGYRLRMRGPGLERSHDNDAFVIKEDGHYKLAALGREPAMLGLRALRLADAGKIEAARQWLDWAREIVQAAGGEDPLDSPPFAALWTRGKAGTLDEVRLAAAALLPSSSKKASALAIPVLVQALEKAPEETKSWISLALGGAYALQEQWKDALACAQRLLAKYPQSDQAFIVNVLALRNLQRHEDLAKMAAERLKRLPNDRKALEVLSEDAVDRGDYLEAQNRSAQIIENDPTAVDYNNFAWYALFVGKDLDKGIEQVRRGLDIRNNSSSLHTLAALYAEAGKTSEARDTILKSMDTAGADEPQSHDWYVLGRIAENYGVSEAAIAAYKRVEKPENQIQVNGSSWVLAQRRLQGLTKK
ncbi:MAG TPA: DUF3857 domain-containing protein [Thermoanaerobaculia bacterium]|nr:DUF3857 domain-containing protein [Thermoanaerobaculia bacterium]